MADKNIETQKLELRNAFDRMIENLQSARDAIDTPGLFPAPATERNLAEGYRYVLGFVLGSIERGLGDPAAAAAGLEPARGEAAHLQVEAPALALVTAAGVLRLGAGRLRAVAVGGALALGVAVWLLGSFLEHGEATTGHGPAGSRPMTSSACSSPSPPSS